MIRKCRVVPGFSVVLQSILITILAGVATVYAQDAASQDSSQQPQAQQPANQQSGSQEVPPEEIPVRPPKPKGYTNWTFNVGGGASLTGGTTQKYVRGGGAIAAAGVARNASKYLGLRLDFQFDNLPLRTTALQLAQAPSANAHMYSLTLGPVINIPVTKDWGGYIIGGALFLHRSGKLDSSTAIPGYACNGFFLWWGHCFNGSLPVSGNFLHSSVNEFGEDFGAGITRRLTPKIELYGEFRYFHGTYNNNTTDIHPITVGIRWGR